jgi:hypothetical protein
LIQGSELCNHNCKEWERSEWKSPFFKVITMYINFWDFGTYNLKPYAMDFGIGNLIFRSSFLCARYNLFLFFFYILCVLLQFLMKAYGPPLYGEGSSAVSLSLFHFVLLCLHIVCQVKHFLYLAWWFLRGKMYSPICVRDLFSSIS